jgi:2-keto-4-pentenoate hydratase/2-oxohepta-3-ene-1,7-dioic acid hydratase in catechol pathway
MRIIRFEYKGKVLWGSVYEEKVHLLKGDIFSGVTETKRKVPLKDVKILPPVSPSKIIGVGLNYLSAVQDYRKDKGIEMEIPKEPRIFFKAPTSIIGHLEQIIYPEKTNRVDYEGELGIVIGKRTKNVTESQAFDSILGYTVVNDVSARDYDRERGKSFDTFCPVGPVIATDLDPHNLHLEIRMNGKIVQSANTRDLLFKVDQMVSFISRVMTLLPGDLIATGTPGVGPMEKGDIVEIEIEGIGILKNFVS